MEPIKDIEKVKRMFAQGQTEIVDTETGYKYSMVAHCPKDEKLAPVGRIEKAGQTLKQVTFICTICFTEFEVGQEDIYLR